MMMDRERLLKEIMAIDFTLLDLNLYLDTHPMDRRALAIYNENIRISKMLRDRYERMFGPLSPTSVHNVNRWQWVESPWPWEKN